MFKADIHYHVNCFTKYIQRFKTANASLVPRRKKLLKDLSLKITLGLLMRLFHMEMVLHRLRSMI